MIAVAPIRGPALERLESALEEYGSQRRGPHWQCPAHDDRTPSLSMTAKNGAALVKCFAGCETEKIVAELGLTLADLFDEPRAIERKPASGRTAAPRVSARVVAVYDYHGEDGGLLFQVVRKEPKAFLQKGPDGQWGRRGARQVPYRLPELIAAVSAGDRVWIVEGEKDVEAMRAAGFVATCNAGGAGKWQPEFSRFLAGAEVTIVADKDEPGMDHARKVFASLRSLARSVSVVQAAVGKDAADHLAAGFGLDDFVPIDLDLDQASDAKIQDASPAPAPDPAERGTSHDALALALVELSGDSIMFSDGYWYVWTGRQWKRDTRDGHAVRALTIEAARKHLPEKSRNLPTIRGAMTLAEVDARVAVAGKDLDADPFALNVRNGTLDLRTGELKPHNRTDRITKLCDLPYDLVAKCPFWDSNLAAMQPDPATRGFLQRLGGSALVGLPGKSTLAILIGSGANWKTTYLESLRDVAGRDYCAEMPPTAFVRDGNSRIEPERLGVPIVGKRLVTSSEPEEGARLQASLIKRWTSDEPIPIRPLYAEQFETTPVATYFMTTNHAPRTDATDEGLWRRVVVVPWKQTIPEADRDLEFRSKMLKAEAPGILAWFVEGARRFLVEGLVERSDEIREASRAYRSDQDPISDFLADCCVERPGARSIIGVFFAAYSAHCQREGERPMSKRALGAALERRGIQRERTKVARFYVGAELTEDGRALVEPRGFDHE